VHGPDDPTDYTPADYTDDELIGGLLEAEKINLLRLLASAWGAKLP